jgi:Lipocalin-like domain
MPRCSMLLLSLAILLTVSNAALIAQPKPIPEQAASVREEFIGSWRLVSVETKRSNGEVIFPFYGKHPEGLLIYDRSGWMSVQIVSDPKPLVPSTPSREIFLGAMAAEKVTAIDGYYAYFGTWTVNPSSSTVTHHIQQSLYPGERGEEGVRRFTFSGNRLTLIAKTHEMGKSTRDRWFGSASSRCRTS